MQIWRGDYKSLQFCTSVSHCFDGFQNVKTAHFPVASNGCLLAAQMALALSDQ